MIGTLWLPAPTKAALLYSTFGIIGVYVCGNIVVPRLSLAWRRPPQIFGMTSLRRLSPVRMFSWDVVRTKPRCSISPMDPASNASESLILTYATSIGQRCLHTACLCHNFMRYESLCDHSVLFYLVEVLSTRWPSMNGCPHPSLVSYRLLVGSGPADSPFCSLVEVTVVYGIGIYPRRPNATPSVVCPTASRVPRAKAST